MYVSTRMTMTQMYYMSRLVRGVSYEELRTWDQRGLRGLHDRGLFRLTAELSGVATRATRVPRLRTNPDAPLFGKRIRIAQGRLRRIA